MKASALKKNMLEKSTVAELVVITAVLVGLNSHLLGGMMEPFIYKPGQSGGRGVAALVLHPFVHVSLYHFILDAGAFLLLWFGLKASFTRRVVYLAVSGIFSFLGVTIMVPEAAASGFCGLSGIAHGLMVIFCLEMATDPSLRLPGVLSLTAVIAKTSYELMGNGGVFAAMHMGMCGNPVPESHAGGILGGVLGFLFFNFGGHSFTKLFSNGMTKFLISTL